MAMEVLKAKKMHRPKTPKLSSGVHAWLQRRVAAVGDGGVEERQIEVGGEELAGLREKPLL